MGRVPSVPPSSSPTLPGAAHQGRHELHSDRDEEGRGGRLLAPVPPTIPATSPRGKNPFQLDSPEPDTDKLMDYLMGENRFASLKEQLPERAGGLYQQEIAELKARYAPAIARWPTSSKGNINDVLT